MTKEYNPPVTIQVYLGSGLEGQVLREKLRKAAKKYHSLSEYVVTIMKKGDPTLSKELRHDDN